jgi:hypothetical protein
MKFLQLFALLSGLFLSVAPSFASSEDMAGVLRRLDALEQSNASLKQQNARLQDKVRRLENKEGVTVTAIPVSASSGTKAQQVAKSSHAAPARSTYDRPRVFDWSGAHVGIFFGYGFGDWTGDAPRLPASADERLARRRACRV